jgi:hypothetical protein
VTSRTLAASRATLLTPAHPAVEEVARMSPMFGRCEDCGGERLFEQPHEAPGSCPDSPDGRCPEWSCTDCGAVLPAACWPVSGQLAATPAVAGRVA